MRYLAVLLFLFIPLFSLSADTDSEADIEAEETETETEAEDENKDVPKPKPRRPRPAPVPFKENLSWATGLNVFYFAADNGPQADPAPVIPAVGFSAAWQFHDFFRLEVTEDIYFTNYEYNTEFGYAMACNPENRSAFVLGFLTGIQLTAAFPIGDRGTTVRVFGGPALDIRIVALAIGLNHPADFTGDIETDPKMQTDAIRDYLWGKGRWFYPVAGLGMDFPINERFLLGFDLRTWFPLYRAWADKDLPKIDGWRFGAGLRLTPIK